MKTIKELMNLRGRVALVSGGAGNIGRAASEALAELGASIVLADRDGDAAEAFSDDLEKRYEVEVLPLSIDLRSEDEIQSVPILTVERFGRLDILINSAALVGTTKRNGWTVPFAQQRLGPWNEALETNLTGVFLLIQACADSLSVSGRGSVVNLGSIYGSVGPDMRLYEGTNMGNPAAYAASKGGLLQLTRWLSTVLAPTIRVNSISPGGIWRNQAEIFRKRYEEKTPMKRMATEEDIKGAIIYLASDMSAYVTGHDLVVDGGWTTW